MCDTARYAAMDLPDDNPHFRRGWSWDIPDRLPHQRPRRRPPTTDPLDILAAELRAAHRRALRGRA